MVRANIGLGRSRSPLSDNILSTSMLKIASDDCAKDGVPAPPNDIYLGSGKSDVIKAMLTMLVADVDGSTPAVMVPIPQYPLFSGILSELGLYQANYYLDESNGWALSIHEQKRNWTEASEKSHVRAMVVINPGNPTGQVGI
ncbi:unnamed protein product [Arctia plantaginis]|uniref:alanine transaminase n=1 Tax=Arctia plantaginis TaxID=874455 RepID=A0A8S0YLJ6_ARCPL|nr:unnamed protein product [Arctia plantaginis]